MTNRRSDTPEKAFGKAADMLPKEGALTMPVSLIRALLNAQAVELSDLVDRNGKPVSWRMVKVAPIDRALVDILDFVTMACVCSEQDETGTVECPTGCLVRWAAENKNSK